MRVFMNDRNRDLFFNEDNEAAVAITLTDEDGNDVEAQILAVIEIEELGKEYAAVLPLDIQEDESDEMEALIFVYSEDEEGNPVFESLEDAEEHEIVASVFNQFFSEAIDEEEEEDSEDSYLDDIGDIIPGVSIQRD
ncbi:DUF1292 domain-containing protein [bacterium D16-51]|nr:DUF1292 domain-containing protein [bacterium D16-59]RKI60609.1 DUF1292 domain-containing protein [bacterium D16-51]